MIFSYVMLDIRSILILKTQKKIMNFLDDKKFLSKAICCFSLQNLPHMQLVVSLSFVKLLWPLVRFISYSHDQDHVHVSTTCYASTLEVSKISSIHKIKLQVHVWHLSKKICQGYGAMRKIKDAYPKKVCHMLRHVKKKDKRCIPKESMPHA